MACIYDGVRRQLQEDRRFWETSAKCRRCGMNALLEKARCGGYIKFNQSGSGVHAGRVHDGQPSRRLVIISGGHFTTVEHHHLPHWDVKRVGR
jgi:hypothetical protein